MYDNSEDSRQTSYVPLTHVLQLLRCHVQGINALVKLLQLGKESTADLHLAETVAVAITILSINNELNQDAVRCILSLLRNCLTAGESCQEQSWRDWQKALEHAQQTCV